MAIIAIVMLPIIFDPVGVKVSPRIVAPIITVTKSTAIVNVSINITWSTGSISIVFNWNRYPQTEKYTSSKPIARWFGIN